VIRSSPVFWISYLYLLSDPGAHSQDDSFKEFNGASRLTYLPRLLLYPDCFHARFRVGIKRDE
jgi:hypothetical protein